MKPVLVKQLSPNNLKPEESTSLYFLLTEGSLTVRNQSQIKATRKSFKTYTIDRVGTYELPVLLSAVF